MGMNDEIRDVIGRALYDATVYYPQQVPWDKMIFKDEWIRKAEEVVKAYLMMKDAIDKTEGKSAERKAEAEYREWAEQKREKEGKNE